MNTDDIFSAEIPIDRFSIYGVNNEEWANIKRSDYCSIGISKRLNSTFELPRKYLIKLFSEKEQYKLLRSELFAGGDNLQKINDEFKLSL